jgi:hypothetical protein
MIAVLAVASEQRIAKRDGQNWGNSRPLLCCGLRSGFQELEKRRGQTKAKWGKLIHDEQAKARSMDHLIVGTILCRIISDPCATSQVAIRPGQQLRRLPQV